MSIGDDIIAIKNAVDNARANRDRAQGKLDLLEKQMKDMGFNSVDELKEEIVKLKKEYDTKLESLTDMVNEFKQKYGDMLK